MAVASVDDVATSLGRPIAGTEEDQVNMWLGDAELQIRLRLGSIADLDQDVVAYVEREAVAARVRNPGGARGAYGVCAPASAPVRRAGPVRGSASLAAR